jgi:hypothetical protein
MEDTDSESDAEMADSSRTMGPPGRGRTFRTMSTHLNVTRESGIGSPVFPVLGGISRFPIPDWPGIGKRETGRFPIGRDRARESAHGPRGAAVPRHAGDFLVWTHGFNLNLKRRRHSDLKIFLYNFPHLETLTEGLLATPQNNLLNTVTVTG